uniref:Uncharacterized protein n=1 Tax=Ciona savignyi TaxID=51511 RepID=H2ZE18_CIOSA
MTLTSVTLKSRPGGLLLHYMVPMVVGFGLVVLLLLILLRYRYKQQMKKHLRMKEAQKMADSLLGSNAKLRSPSSVKRDRIYDHVSKLDFGQEGEDDVFLPTQATTNLHRSCKSAENLSPNRKRYDKVRHKSDVTRRDELKPFLIEETETVSEKLKKRRLLSYNGDFSASDTWSYRQSSSSNTSNNNTAPLQKKESTSSMSETDEEVAKVFERDNHQNINVKTKDVQTIQEP